MTIKRVLLANHTHHDIGYNDYQGMCLRQHGEFIDAAMDLMEQTTDAVSEEQYRWVCEITGPLIRHLRRSPASTLDRVRYWNERGNLEIAAMQYNTTPLQSPEQMRRSLYPVQWLRDQGLTVRAAMQDDVNGISWLFSDYLLDLGVEFLTMAINQSRGRAPRPFPGGMLWETPSGRQLPVWNGFHYLFGRSQAKLGRFDLAPGALASYLTILEADGFPYDMLYAEATHPMRVDNGPPDACLIRFVHHWNEEGRTPRLEFSTPSRYFDELTQRGLLNTFVPVRGDWTDWWADGAASSAYETGENRATHARIAAIEALRAMALRLGIPDMAEASRMDQLYEAASLYDEHTWGSFASIAAPDTLMSRAQWNRKAGYAFQAALESHDLLTRQARALAARVGLRGPEGMFNLGDLPPEIAYPEPDARWLLVVNPSTFDRTELVDVPEYRAGGAPAGMLESEFPRDVPWGGPPHSPLQRVRVSVFAGDYAFVPVVPVTGDDLNAEPGLIENHYYRVTVDGRRGGISSILDKELGVDLTRGPQAFGRLVRETVASPLGRDALYQQDFASWDFGYWHTDVPFVREACTRVEGLESGAEAGVAHITWTTRCPGARSARCTVELATQERRITLRWFIDKEPFREPESLYVLFDFGLQRADFLADVNGLPLRPDEDQVPGSVLDFHPIGRWVAASDGRTSVMLVPQTAPLVQLGGINTNRIMQRFGAQDPTIVSWAMNNHWMVNFRAEQPGPVELVYHVSSRSGGLDVCAAERFGERSTAPLIVLRDYEPQEAATHPDLPTPTDPRVRMNYVVDQSGRHVLLRLLNLSEDSVHLPELAGLPCADLTGRPTGHHLGADPRLGPRCGTTVIWAPDGVA